MTRSRHGRPALTVSRRLLAPVLLGLLGGCSFYRAMPLNPATVDKALQAPPIETVRIAAAKLDHPLVKSMMIDGEGGFTPDEIAVMAVIVSPQLRTVRDQRGLAQAQVVQAGRPKRRCHRFGFCLFCSAWIANMMRSRCGSRTPSSCIWASVKLR